MSRFAGRGRSTALNSRVLTRALAGTALGVLAIPSVAVAQDSSDSSVASEEGNVIVVTGIRSSLQSALNEQRNADSIIEVIQAEDIGKLPDQN
ncbi:MAG: hypothetical protein KJP27_06575, partial [Altererythrobacter sp.]|nr:hypothetical protein [Altererythrobacter sp.]